MEELPAEVGDLLDLRTLGVSSNRLALLPESLGQLSLLEFLFANGNRLHALPAELAGLMALKKVTNLALRILTCVFVEVHVARNLLYFYLFFVGRTTDVARFSRLSRQFGRAIIVVSSHMYSSRLGTLSVFLVAKEKLGAGRVKQMVARAPSLPEAPRYFRREGRYIEHARYYHKLLL